MTAHDKMQSRVYLKGDNLWISTASLQISDHCRVKVRATVWVADCCIPYKLLEEVTKCRSIT